MSKIRERVAERLHLPIALASIWLLASSPWLQMRRLVPEDAGLINQLHIWLGAAMAGLGLVYFIAVLPTAGRDLFPWIFGRFAPLGRDLAGLARARIPGPGGGGLFSILQGLLMLSLLAASWTGMAWWWSDGARVALAWREWHASAAQAFGVLLVLHMVAVATHVLDFLRD